MKTFRVKKHFNDLQVLQNSKEIKMIYQGYPAADLKRLFLLWTLHYIFKGAFVIPQDPNDNNGVPCRVFVLLQSCNTREITLIEATKTPPLKSMKAKFEVKIAPDNSTITVLDKAYGRAELQHIIDNKIITTQLS